MWLAGDLPVNSAFIDTSSPCYLKKKDIMSNSRLLSILGKVITEPERGENIVCPDLPPVIAPLITFCRWQWGSTRLGLKGAANAVRKFNQSTLLFLRQAASCCQTLSFMFWGFFCSVTHLDSNSCFTLRCHLSFNYWEYYITCFC